MRTFSALPHRSHIAALLLLLAGAAHAQTPVPLDSVVILDANGKTVGHASGSAPQGNGNLAVSFSVNGQPFSVQVGPSGFASGPNAADRVRFDAPDCMGTPYVQPFSTPAPQFIPPATVVPPGHSAYVASPTDITLRTIAQMSEAETDGRGCLNISISIPNVVPAVKVTELDVYFAAPFHIAPMVVAASCCGDCNGDGTVKVNEIVQAVGDALNGCPMATP